ncbi:MULTISPECIES: leucine--tRNA ligase [unclassified Variovorax]|uniref:leucine--tRNA ligase n=1 Tax=unclassified Variovorax TaxID=663243 RepID=UPI000F7E1B29|nr:MULTISPECIES: leucine--tRNA ligase [unclassified Variovorax]RSZ42583.1 leucine--tRNA ligase [Variovorax sp. 553]RSZ43558.1 leucine--tRNA ligase [Variovorax sp. 679]
MNPSYKPSDVESAAQAQWSAADAYRVTEDASRKKYYACSMLPYPSGKLHMGHVRNYTINDMLTRYLRMSGYNVLMPMGWDAFGLPAENAALKNGVPPARWTYENIAYMKGQLQAMGLAIDWSREIATCDPSYYKWNQWLFLKMLEKGIAYRKTQVVNWDPVDQTVLANEQVIDGKGWRTGATVERREIPGYYLKISDYAEELLEHTQHKLPGWPERVKLMQENWIGKSEGVRFAFTHDIKGADGKLIQDGRMYVFTTRADTIMGVTFCAVAPEHPLAAHAATLDPKVAAFIEECKSGGTTEAELATQEKKGVPTGLTVMHPITEEQVPVWVGNYVLIGYGDGAVMGVPAHDERDFAFANKYGIEIIQVVLVDDEPHFDYHKWQDWYGDKQRGVTINSDNFSGMTYKEAVAAVAHALGQKGLGELQTTWRLRDWGVSRQRYWGTPIPIIHCDEHGAVPVPEKDLPVVLPTDCVPDGSGNPLHKHEGFHAGVVCPVCGRPARRETDTMDTFVDSSWYFMRYCDPKNDEAMVAGGADYWMPMDQYIGGIEHAILHLLYARFWTKVMRDLGLVKADEPFSKLLTQGMVLNHIFYNRGDKGEKNYFPPAEVTPVVDAQGRITGGTLADGTKLEYGGVGKMGKTERNGVDPQDLIEKYGADTARLYTMFTAPPEATLEWNDSAVEGSYRFLRRVWNFGVSQADVAPVTTEGQAFGKGAQALRREVHTVLRQVDYDYQRMQYNTVVSGAMKLLNALEGFKPDGSASDAAAVREGFGILLRCLYPATPHIAQQLWNELGYDKESGGLLDAPWPTVDVGALVQDEIELMLQVNGKLRGKLSVPAGASKDEIEKLALACDDFVAFAEGAPPKRVIVVPGRLVNVVI